MDIKLKPVNPEDGDAFYFPSLPESVSRKLAAKMQSFDIISKGTVKVPKGMETREYRWSGEFFGRAKMGEPIVRTQHWMEPRLCVKTLREWMKGGTVLAMTVSGAISINVTIASLECENYGAFGNVRYTIELYQHRKLKIYTTNEMTTASFVKKTKDRETDSGPDAGGRYTVRSGDTLCGIASRKCGGGANWIKLYSANKDVIESAARSRGKSSSDKGALIWPGTTLTLVQ